MLHTVTRTLTARLVSVVGAFGVAVALSSCGSDDARSDGTAVTESGPGGTASVVVDNKPVDVVGKAVTCVERDGTVAIFIGDHDPVSTASSGIGAVVTSGDSPKVETLYINGVDGQNYALSAGVPGTSAQVSKAGAAYTITGTIVGATVANPTVKQTTTFEIKVTCP